MKVLTVLIHTDNKKGIQSLANQPIDHAAASTETLTLSNVRANL